MREFDVIVIGCGHAGCEAAATTARLGVKTLLIGMNLDTLAWMPCNPAIGGPAKSHLVKEIDALGGLMGEATDATYIQLKTLNSSRGAAVHSLRAQSDKYQYSSWMRQTLQAMPNITMYQSMVTKVNIESEKVIGVETSLGEEIRSKAVIITSGTFLQGKIYTGKISSSAGRFTEGAAIGLTDSLREHGIEIGRLKTGTPARLDARSIDFSKLEKHPGDSILKFFSFLPNRPILEQALCYATRTTEVTHQIIRDNLHESPLYSGMIEGIGPRYCPSIEDKIVRFTDKSSHLLFLEPEGRNTNEIYLQGCSTSLPIQVQWKIIRSLSGLENADIVRPAYAVEYDFLKPIQFKHTLETKSISGLFAAGQLLGTSGYEEAAAQGLVAGLNAGLYVLGREPFSFDRSESYIGTLIDDLVMKEITEPYRMMTSRSEYRLYLRQDNADRRMTPTGRKLGLVNDYRWQIFNEKMNKFENGMNFLKNTKPVASQTNQQLLGNINQMSLSDLLARPDIDFNFIDRLTELPPEYDEIKNNIPKFEIETEIKYAGYVRRQNNHVNKISNLENKKIPENIDYISVKHLSKEAREKLSKFKPQTFEQAMRIDGVSPADISVLMIYLAAIQRKLNSEN